MYNLSFFQYWNALYKTHFRSLFPPPASVFVFLLYLCTMSMFESVLLLIHHSHSPTFSFFAVQIGFDVHLFVAHFRTVELKKDLPREHSMNFNCMINKFVCTQFVHHPQQLCICLTSYFCTKLNEWLNVRVLFLHSNIINLGYTIPRWKWRNEEVYFIIDDREMCEMKKRKMEKRGAKERIMS